MFSGSLVNMWLSVAVVYVKLQASDVRFQVFGDGLQGKYTIIV